MTAKIVMFYYSCLKQILIYGSNPETYIVFFKLNGISSGRKKFFH